jgi:phenylpyruvate tautomerase
VRVVSSLHPAVDGGSRTRLASWSEKEDGWSLPYLAVTTNVEISEEPRRSFLNEASKAVAAGTGKPEQYVMVKLDGGQPLLFGGTDAPAAFLDVKSIGFPADGVQGLATSLCDLVSKHLGVPGERTYLVFTDVRATMWGHDGEMFG